MPDLKDTVARRQELVAALSVILPDEELFELIERSDASSDPVAVLQSAYEIAASTSVDVDAMMTAHRLAIVEVTAKRQNKDREVVDVVVGFELQWHNGEHHLYAGKTLSFGPRYKAIPFESISDAKRAALVWIDLQSEQSSYPATVRKRLKVPVVTGLPMPKSGSQVNWKMTVDETAKMDCILRGLRSANAELEPNSPVASYVDVLRWMVRKLFA